MITVSLTQDEIAERAKSLAQYANKLAELSDEEESAKARHKQLMADIKERRLDISNELRRLSRAVRLGVEERATQQVFWEEEQRLEEFRREQEVKRRAEGAIEQAEEMIEQQQQAEMEEASREAVAEFFGGNEEAREWNEAAGDFIKEIDAEEEAQRAAGEDYQAEWRECLNDEARSRYYNAPCACGHIRDYHAGSSVDGQCGLCESCQNYHCPACGTLGGHQATCEHYVRGEWTPVQDAFTAPRCDECKMIEGGHAQTCSKSDTLTYDDYFRYSEAHNKDHHASHARKMDLKRNPKVDAKVREWKRRQQAGNSVETEPEPASCVCGHSRGAHITGLEGQPLGMCAKPWCKCESFVEAGPEPKRKGRKKLSPVEAAIDR